MESRKEQLPSYNHLDPSEVTTSQQNPMLRGSVLLANLFKTLNEWVVLAQCVRLLNRRTPYSF